MEPNDEVMNQVDTELSVLQNNLKDRLKETNELGDLNQSVLDSTMSLEKHTAQLEHTSRLMKYKWLFEYIKWMLIAGVLLCLVGLLIYKTLFK